jgi:nucleoside-diphosphate-sugar epimerase
MTGYDNVLVTGASGLLGSNICRLAAADGRKITGLVRTGADAEMLRGLGVEAVIGDITDRASLDAATRDMDGLIHCAALLSGPWSSFGPEDFDRVNYQGSMNVLRSATANGVDKTVLIGSMVMFDSTATVTETSPLAQVAPDGWDYAREKLATYYEGMRRVCRGENHVFVVPWAMYGPSPFVDRALRPELVTTALWSAIKGMLTEYVRFPLTWPYAKDAARTALAALDGGVAGRTYLASGPPDEALSLAGFCNIGCELAGVTHRVREVEIDELSEDLGPVREMAERSYPTPLVDPSLTNAELGITPTSVHDGLEETVRWLKDNDRI